jgi:hypothetical protein
LFNSELYFIQVVGGCGLSNYSTNPQFLAGALIRYLENIIQTFQNFIKRGFLVYLAGL